MIEKKKFQEYNNDEQIGDDLNMKKFVAFSLAAVLIIFSVFSVSASTIGDSDNDGSIGIMDATLIQMFVAQRVNLDDESLVASDVDGDGLVSILDCTCIQQFIAQIITTFPAQNDIDEPTENPPFEFSTSSGLTSVEPTTPVKPTEEVTEAPTEYTGPNTYDLEILELVNVERAKEGLQPLEYAYFIFDCAKTRAIESDLYFSHTRPDGTPWHTVFETLEQIPDRAIVGENLAWGHETAEEVMYDEYGWMNSPGHRANIMNPRYKYVAIASVECTEQPGTFCTVQLFWG